MGTLLGTVVAGTSSTVILAVVSALVLGVGLACVVCAVD